ncbi:MAG: efflux transporter outer membrane subunit [Flavisolibacter sp.]|nr:efflux transporter outer membrane subunit [Flavisolibacter sp.]
MLLVLVMTSCKITQRYTRPNVGTDNLYRDVTTTDTTSIATLPYTQIFTDTALQRLIAQGIANNPNLLVAYTRIQQAQATYLQSRAAFFPALNANTGVTTSHLSNAQRSGVRTDITQYTIGLSSSWEVDIWGQLRSSRRADLANLLQTEAATRAVQTGLVADIANNYFLLLALDRQLLVTRQTVANWDTTVLVLRALKEAARVTEAAVVQSEAQRYAAEVTIPDLERNIRETENGLSILLGLPPGPINRSDLYAQQPIAALQTGVPALLLANRPDVQEAEYNYRFFFELTNVARTNFYPALTITASTGLSALQPGNIFLPGSLAASIGAGLTQPIFNRRANRTRLEIARAQQQGALIGFQNALLNAGREVSDALYLYQTAFNKAGIRTNEITALNQAVSYTQELLRYGFATYTEVITARQSLLQAQLGSINDRLQQLQATVNLYRSLGGGWR